MGLMRSIYAGVSGLRNHQLMMDVIGNNIANVNTIGFKAGRVSFAETFAQTLQGSTQSLSNVSGTNPMQVGLGMSVATIDTIFNQGNIETTGQITDLAIQGNGFFIVSDGSQKYYTRAGSFQISADGKLVMPGNGMAVQGYMANADGIIAAGTPLSDLSIPAGLKIPGKATSRIELGGNLDASAEPVGTILKSKKIFAVEKAGSGSDIEGLLATGTTNDIITGMIPNSTTITITDSVVGTKTYTYVDTDTVAGNGAFNSLDDLVAEINNDFGSSSLTVSINAQGALVFTDVSGGSNVLSIDSNNPLLAKAFLSANGDLNAGPKATDQFSHVATSKDLLVDLRAEDGTSLGLANGDEVTINGLVGKNNITPYSFTIDATTTYGDFARNIEAALSITNSKGVQIDSEGALTINGDGGTAYEISALDIRADDTPGAGGTARTVFNNIFDSTSGNYDVLQKAADVQQSTTYTIYDSQGNALDVTLIFTKDAAVPNRWNWEAKVNEPAVLTGGNKGYVDFNQDGSFKSLKYADGSSSLQIQPANSGADIVSVDIFAGKNGEFGNLTQLSGANSNVVVLSQNGHSMGILQQISVDKVGRITGAFTNGITKLLGQIALADFNNPGGLVRTKNNLYTESANSGNPMISPAGDTINAAIISGAVEQSNVDLAEEFTKMIVAQRGFQANARVITTSDDLLAEIANLKR